jgi:gamma-butyrobetaine dioxygenase
MAWEVNMRVDVDKNNAYLTLITANQECRFHAIWLRDNASDPNSRSPDNGQSLIALRDIPRDITISAAALSDDILRVTFSPEDKTCDYPLNWLLDNAYDRPGAPPSGWTQHDVETWDSTLMSQLPQADFATIKSDPSALADWLAKINRFGFGKLQNGPVEDKALLQVVDLFGYVHETIYGPYFDVRAEAKPSNLAYTNLGLQAHTDNPYSETAPPIQILYCLQSDAAGGENMIVDGFRAVERLRAENPDWFNVLARYCANFEYVGRKDVCLRARRPMIELAPDGELIGMRFNNRATAALTDIPFSHMKTYYDAYRRLGEIIDDPDMEVSFRLAPGDSFLINNRRVLHAPRAFSSEGQRWLQGCYADMGALRSKLTVLQAGLTNAAPEAARALEPI